MVRASAAKFQLSFELSVSVIAQYSTLIVQVDRISKLRKAQKKLSLRHLKRNFARTQQVSNTYHTENLGRICPHSRVLSDSPSLHECKTVLLASPTMGV
jgi:hypothetical protein